MPKFVGGRGKKAPYQTQMVRCPVAIKPQVEKLIDDYRAQLLTTEAEKQQLLIDLESQTDIEAAIKLLDQFAASIGQTEHLNQRSRRNNVNLSRFRDWLTAKLEQ